MGGLIPGSDPKHASIGQLANLNSGFNNNQNQLSVYQQALAAAQAAQGGSAPTMQAAQLGAVPLANAAAVAPAALTAGGNINMGLANSQLGNENALMGGLAGLATGQNTGIPSLAQSQLQQATQQNIAQLAGTAASQAGAGVSPGMALQALLQAQGGANQTAALQSAQTAAQQQQNALAQLSSLVPTVAAQQQGLATTQAGLGEQTGLANQAAVNTANQLQAQYQQAANLANQSMQGQYGLQQGQFTQAANTANQQAALQYLATQNQQQQAMLNTGLTAAQYANTNQQAGQQLLANQGIAQAQISQGANNQEAQTSGQIAGGLAAAGGAIGAKAASDEDMKENIEPAGDDLQKYLDALSAHSYNYKDPTAPGAGPGTYVSPMAQELEDSDLGKQFVFAGPDGNKMVDYGHQAGTMLAALAHINSRMNKLEAR